MTAIRPCPSSAPPSTLEDPIECYRHSCRYLEALVSLCAMPSHRVGRPGLVGLQRARRLLEHLGHPEQKLRFLHVTGTSGKGSTVHLLHRILTAAGFRVGSALSPHILTPLERVAWGPGLLPLEVWNEGMARLQPWIEAEYREGPFGIPSYQEILFGLALWSFERLGADWAVIEVGIGGRHDTTNLIPPPVLAVITEVGLDHTELLGPDIPTIARDKAGIFKPGSVALTGARRLEALAVLQEEAAHLGIPLWCVGSEGSLQLSEDGRLESRERVQAPFALREDNAAQRRNRALVLECIERLRGQGFDIPDEAIRRGCEDAFLPGRLERIPLSEGGVLLLDMAHNPDKINLLVDDWLERHGRGGCAVVACSEGRDVRAMLESLARAFSPILATRPLGSFRRLHPPHVLQELARERNLELEVRLDPRQALREAFRRGGGRSAVTGSAYLVGELRAWLEPEDVSLKRGGVAPMDPAQVERRLREG